MFGMPEVKIKTNTIMIKMVLKGERQQSHSGLAES